MATVSEVKAKLLDRLMAMDVSNASICEIGQYVGVLKCLSDISDKTYGETLADMVKSFDRPKPAESATIGYCLGGE